MKKFREILSSGERGFTLIELLVVIAVLGILAGIAVPRLGGVTDKAELTEAVSAIGSIKTAMEMAKVEYDNYPTFDGSGDKDILESTKIGEYIESLPDGWTYKVDTGDSKIVENEDGNVGVTGNYRILVVDSEDGSLAAEFVEGNGKVQTTTDYKTSN